MRGIALQIRPAGRAIEHVIRRKVHEPGVELAACQRQIAHRQRIHQEGRLWFAFRHVNLVVGLSLIHISIDALNAGKDVYVEKPLTRLREEGPEIVRAARLNNRVCQVGMQQRSGEVYLEARERFVRAGMLGKISHVDCVWHGGANRALPTEPARKPANLDWVRFLGPLKYRDWNPAPYLDFRAFLDFGGGKLTDFGAHWLDVVHMFMEQDGPLSACLLYTSRCV